MSDNKKYYYLKLKDNFFDSDEMILLESMQDGYIYSNILLKLYLRSLKNGGRLMLNDRIPFNPTMLSQVTRHSVGDVEKAANIFKDLGIIEVLDNGAIYMTDIQNFIGSSSSEADRKRDYRHKIESEVGHLSGHLVGHSSDKTPPKIKIKKEIEKQKFVSSFFSIDEVVEIVTYRKSIGSPLKSQQGYTGLENKIRAVMNKYNIGLDKVLAIMADKEWKSIEVDYIKNTSPIQAKRKEVLI